MYRLSGPKLVIFGPLILIGIIVSSIIPNYFGELRALSMTSLLIGEVGLSFIPVLALYPKATPIQAGILALVYFLTIFIICFASWGLNSFGLGTQSAFFVKDENFHINTYALFFANLVSLLSMVTNFKLIYDEELTKETHSKSKGKYKRPSFFGYFQKPLAQRTLLQGPRTVYKKTFDTPRAAATGGEKKLDDVFEKPFEFEPEIDLTPESLPLESSGKLFADEKEEKKEDSEFFISDTDSLLKEELEEEPPFKTEDLFPKEDLFAKKEEIEKPKPIPSPLQPSDIKGDLEAIFEQYSSLNAVKKLTSEKNK